MDEELIFDFTERLVFGQMNLKFFQKTFREHGIYEASYVEFELISYPV